MKKITARINFLKLGVLLFGVSLLLWNCEKEDTITENNSIYKTVSTQESIDFLKGNKSNLYQKRKNQQYAVPFIEKITYEEITNSDELLAVIPAITVYKKHYSRILLLKINNQIESVVFSMYSNKKVNTKKFSGEIMITDLNGKFLNGYKIYDGVLISKYNLASKYKKKTSVSKSSKYFSKSNEECPNGHSDEDPECIFNEQNLDEIVIHSRKRRGPMAINFLFHYEGIEREAGWNSGDDSRSDTGMSWDYGDDGGGGNSNNSYVDRIINELTGKALCVYNKLERLSGGFKDAIQKFDGEFPVSHLKFEMENLGNSRGETRPPINGYSPNYTITIVINNNSNIHGVGYRPNLMTAKTIAHEVIHAEMFRKLMSLTKKPNFNLVSTQQLETLLSNGDYPGIYDYYRRHRNWQHQQMATHYRQTIADMLKAFDNNQHINQFYLDTAWEGLIKSNISAWTNQSQQEKDRIKKVINDYINNNSNQSCTE